jgi:hypothetical protein
MKRVKGFLGNAPSDELPEILAWQSFKKILPPSCKCMEGDLIRKVAEKLASPPRRLPSGYVSFARRICKGLFVKGWDKTYLNQCTMVSPPLKGTVEASRRNGGSLEYGGSQDLYLEAVYGEKEYAVPDVSGELMVVQSAGKPRPLTKFSQESLLLKPLHKTLYDHISAQRWLCRGDVTAEKLQKAGFRYDENEDTVLVSGDYASATDNLPIEIAEVILECAREGAQWVPKSVWEHAFKSMRPVLWNLEYDLEVVARTGQMMGSLLSFPLLCIQNYVAFRWARHLSNEGGRLPVIINGDDILFQSSRRFASTWMNVVNEVGLEVEKTKTSVDASFGTLNSTLLEWNSGGILVPRTTLRFGLLRPRDFPNGLGKDFLQFIQGQTPEVKWAAGKAFFRWHIDLLRRSGHTFANEWGFRGRLASRISSIFGVAPTSEAVKLPDPPKPHTVVLPPEITVTVDKGSLTEELQVLNALEMVAWKWSADHVDVSERNTIRYCLELSMSRVPSYFSSREEIARTGLWTMMRLTPPSRRWVDKQFKVQPYTAKEIVFREVLLSQDFSDYSRLPTYEDALTEGVCAQHKVERRKA